MATAGEAEEIGIETPEAAIGTEIAATEGGTEIGVVAGSARAGAGAVVVRVVIEVRTEAAVEVAIETIETIEAIGASGAVVDGSETPTVRSPRRSASWRRWLRRPQGTLETTASPSFCRR